MSFHERNKKKKDLKAKVNPMWATMQEMKAAALVKADRFSRLENTYFNGFMASYFIFFFLVPENPTKWLQLKLTNWSAPAHLQKFSLMYGVLMNKKN